MSYSSFALTSMQLTALLLLSAPITGAYAESAEMPDFAASPIAVGEPQISVDTTASQTAETMPAMPAESLAENFDDAVAEACQDAGGCKQADVADYFNSCYGDTRIWAPERAPGGEAIGAREIIEYCYCAARGLVANSMAGCPDRLFVVNRKQVDGRNTTASPWVEIVDWTGIRGPYNGVSIRVPAGGRAFNCDQRVLRGPVAR